MTTGFEELGRQRVPGNLKDLGLDGEECKWKHHFGRGWGEFQYLVFITLKGVLRSIRDNQVLIEKLDV